MTEARLALSELLEKAGDGDFLRTVAEAVLQLLMEADVEGLIGAGRYERSGERTTWRNGHRERRCVIRRRPGYADRIAAPRTPHFSSAARPNNGTSGKINAVHAAETTISGASSLWNRCS